MSEVKIHLTEEQQKQIKNTTGKDITELNLKDLEKASGGGDLSITMRVDHAASKLYEN